ncbi:RDD family protein [Rhizobium binxianense]|uniref:RDD family protein n=1 Tax=Rhizobium binxianense TaxID=3024242 RepID=UPI002360E9BA|nr:RDD family protein [Rhizobium sp. MJ37]MDC9833677.1 RDD family protein [Rhizobium sp. MJ37]
MDNTAEMPQSMTLPFRHFWRRFAAFAVDIIIFQAAILIAVHYISTVFPLDFRFPGRTSTWCTEAIPSQLAQRIEAGWPLPTDEIRTSEICEVGQIGSTTERYLRTGNKTEDDFWTSGQELIIPLDADNNPVVQPMPAYSSLISGIANTVLIALAFACFSANGRRTFGKAVFFLRVQSVDGKYPDIGAAFKREILKFSPFLLISAVVFVISLFPIYPTQDFEALLDMVRDGYTPPDNDTTELYVIWATAAMAWWLLPFVWRGHAFYDHICACEVVNA